jgi:hypothetical protein
MDNALPPDKFVVRNLPPTLSEEIFHNMLLSVLQDELEWFRYHPGKEGYATRALPYHCCFRPCTFQTVVHKFLNDDVGVARIMILCCYPWRPRKVS